MNIKNNQAVLAVSFIIIAGLSFFAGTKYQSRQLLNLRGQFASGRNMDRVGNQPGNRNRFGGRQLVGEITGQDDKSVTIKLSDGSSKIIFLSQSTSFNQAVPASVSDLKLGTRIGVFGNENANGTLNAQSVQINPPTRESGSTPAAR